MCDKLAVKHIRSLFRKAVSPLCEMVLRCYVPKTVHTFSFRKYRINISARIIRPFLFTQDLPKFSHTIPLLCFLQRIPAAACIISRSPMLADEGKNEANTLLPQSSYSITPPTAPRPLGSFSPARLFPPSLKARVRHASRLFSAFSPI